MKTLQRWMISAVIYLSGCFFGIAQSDTFVKVDTLQNEIGSEEVLEQNTDLEDSPLLDFLFPEISTVQSGVQIRSRISRHLQPSIGYIHGDYKGSSLKSYQRIKSVVGQHLSGGIILEKDAGEKRLHDFLAGNLVISKIGPVEKCVLGDYYIESGQGIALWRCYDIAKGADIISPVKRNPGGLKPYLSSSEADFFRGAGMEFLVANILSTAFISRMSKSASIDSFGNITGFYSAGYFRTDTEQKKRNNVTEKSFGIRSLYELSSNNTIGMTFYKSFFSKPLQLDEGNRFRGEKMTSLSIDYHLSISTISIFGEWASANHVVAGTAGILISPLKTLQVITTFRNYPYKFYSPHGLGFGERSNNEQGFYIGVRTKVLKYLLLSSYYDMFSFSGHTGSKFSSSGDDFLIQIGVNPSSKLAMICRYRRKLSLDLMEIEGEDGFKKRVKSPIIKHSVRITIDYDVSKVVRMRGRFEGLYLNRPMEGNESGTIFYQDVVFTPVQSLWLNLRLAFFRTDSYSSGIYEYERDLDGVLSQPILYGKGSRWYLFLKYEISGTCKMSLKYSDDIRDDVKKIGTGLDQLSGNHDDRIGFQLDFKY